MKRVVQLILILVLILISSCKKNTYPSLEECDNYMSELNKCGSLEGCIYVSSTSTIITPDKDACYIDKQIYCVPGNNVRGDNTREYCRINEDGSISRLTFGNAYDYKLGDEWSEENCPTGFNDCYLNIETCSSIQNIDECIRYGCVWVVKAYKAILEDDTCVGWENNPIQGCYARPSRFGSAIKWNTLWYHDNTTDSDATMLVKIIYSLYNLYNYDYSYSVSPEHEEIFCTGDSTTDLEICNCPEPPEK